MLAVVGTLLLSAALLVFAWARVEHQRPRPARWLRHEIASQLVVFVILMFLAGGIGLILHVVGNYDSNRIGLVEGGLIAAIALAALLLHGAFRRYAQRSLGEAAAAGLGPTGHAEPPEDDVDPATPGGRPAGGGRRRAA